jgi:ABC-type polysaccharide/polyol phosphate export permease
LFPQHIGRPIVTLPLLLLVQALLTTGLLYFLATLNVFFHDLQHLIQIVLMLLFFLVPIFYSINQVPESARPIITANLLLSTGYIIFVRYRERFGEYV